MNLQESVQPAARVPDSVPSRQAEILGHLKQIQNSHAFSNSTRSKEFLSYVVEQALAGNSEGLKERSIGINLFHRAPTYDTGEDPIVRVKAGEVRRRLAEYYAGEQKAPELQIELPVGSYVPKFRWKAQPTLPSVVPGIEVVERPPEPPKQSRNWKIAGLVTALAMIGLATAFLIRAYYHPASALDQFWEPISSTKQPVLICVPSPVGYAVSSDLFQESPAAKTGIYDSVMERNATPLQLDPDTTIKWKEITPLADFYVDKDDAYVAEGLSSFFASEHRPSQVRFGNDYTYEDIRSSPAILVGAYNNPWADRVMSDLPFVFRESGEVLWIEDRTKPGQTWKASLNGRLGSKDFALVARMLNSKTGQFLVIVSGVGMVGTKAAGKIITHEEDLKAALSSATPGWEKKNLEFVIETDIVDTSPSPSHVVAMKSW